MPPPTTGQNPMAKGTTMVRAMAKQTSMIQTRVQMKKRSVINKFRAKRRNTTKEKKTSYMILDHWPPSPVYLPG
jgi:hypothetical protein